MKIHLVMLMSDQSIQLSSLFDIRSKAEVDLRRAERSLQRAKDQVDAAKSKVNTIQEIINTLTKVGPPQKSQKHQIRDVIRSSAGEGITANLILARLTAMGVQFSAKNPTASIHVAADRLVDDGCVESLQTAEGKIYKWKGEAVSATEAADDDDLEDGEPEQEEEGTEQNDF